MDTHTCICTMCMYTHIPMNTHKCVLHAGDDTTILVTLTKGSTGFGFGVDRNQQSAPGKQATPF